MKKIEILMDYRESNGVLIKSLMCNPSVNLKIGTLKTGDYLINDQLLVERKTLKNLVSSTKDGRMFQQAANLASSLKYCMIILEGTSRDIQSAKMKRVCLVLAQPQPKYYWTNLVHSRQFLELVFPI